MCSRLTIKRPRAEICAPKPVRLRGMGTHGLFGIRNVRQHMVIDGRWTPNTVSEHYKGINDLFARFRTFQNMEIESKRKSKIKRFQALCDEIRDGRQKLVDAITGNNQNVIRNILINHSDLQRLYQKMPLHMAVDNINQRTFVMRKERDRLQHRLKELKRTYEICLKKRADIQTCIKYQSEYVLEEEVTQGEYRMKIENSQVRLRAIKMIHQSYDKMKNVLEHDEIFYEPILVSLFQDLNNQETFIRQILHFGKPTIKKYAELSKEYRKMDANFRQTINTRRMSRKKDDSRASEMASLVRSSLHEEPINTARRFVRETDSMLELKNVLQSVENVLKEIKQATLSSSYHEIYPRIKAQVESNEALKTSIMKANMKHDHLVNMMKNGNVQEGVLVNNYNAAEIARQQDIKELQAAIRKEEQYEASLTSYLKNRADGYVLLRFSLWNLFEQLRDVDHDNKYPRKQYPNSYLRLPLLRFEMFQMRAVPPQMFEKNLEVLVSSIKNKVKKLIQKYPKKITPAEIQDYRQQFHLAILQANDNAAVEEEVEPQEDDEEDLVVQIKSTNVPNRKAIKSQSAKLVEEYSKIIEE